MMSMGKKQSLVVLASLAAAGCMPPENIFTPESGTHFNANSGTVVIEGLTEASAVCYTVDGSEPVWNSGTCDGGTTQRIQGPVVSAQIPLTCGEDTGENVGRLVRLKYDWSGVPGQSASANYYLNCGNDDNGGGDNGGGDQPQNLTLTPVADAYVDASKGGENFGFDTQLYVDQDPQQMHAFLRFSVPTLTANLQSATLRLYGTDWTPDGPKVYRTSNNWNEGSITWNNQPSPSGSAIADTGDIPVGWVDIDVTDAISGSGDISFVLIPDSNDGFDFDSREALNSPELIIVTGDGGSGGGTGGGSASGSDVMAVGQSLYSNEYLVSGNGMYRFYLQSDGNLVLRDWQTRDSIWSSGTHGQNGTRLTLQSDSNLVLYTDSGSPVWASNTVGAGADRLRLSDDGTLALYQGNSVVWGVGGSGSGGGSGSITHVGTTETYDSNGQDMKINRPSGSKPGDLLVLVLHRTDDYLPLNVNGWNRAAQCYKRDNGYDCVTYEDCVSWRTADICESFGSYGRGGRDLAQSIFYKTVGSNEPGSYTFDLNPDSSGHPGWAILTALRGANTSDPVRDWANEGCDGSNDSLFPSVYGKAGDMVLLSQSFDDAVAQSKFNPPDGTTNFGYVSESDEAGFLFGGILDSTGETGKMKTHGEGASGCKDALISLTIKPQ